MLYYTGFFGEKSRKSLQGQRLMGEVVQIFEHTINIVLKKQFPNLLTVGGMQVLGSPQSIAFKDFSQMKDQLKVGDMCILQGGSQLIFARLTGQLQEVEECSLVEQMTIPTVENLARRKDFLASKLTEKNLYQTQPGIAPFYQQLQKEVIQLQEALILGDWFNVEKHVQGMVGLGIGLTPSGDDILTGMLLVLFDESTLKSIVLQASPNTNFISQHQLYFASQGLAKPSVLTVVQEIFSERMRLDVLEKAIRETLTIGSTSGHDLLSGIVAGLQVRKRKGEEKNECSSKSNSQSLH